MKTAVSISPSRVLNQLRIKAKQETDVGQIFTLTSGIKEVGVHWILGEISEL